MKYKNKKFRRGRITQLNQDIQKRKSKEKYWIDVSTILATFLFFALWYIAILARTIYLLTYKTF